MCYLAPAVGAVREGGKEEGNVVVLPGVGEVEGDLDEGVEGLDTLGLEVVADLEAHLVHASLELSRGLEEGGDAAVVVSVAAA